MSSTTLQNNGKPTNDAVGNDWLSWGDGFIEQEKIIWRNTLPLAVTTSVITALYSYYMIDQSTNNAVNRALLMSLATLLGATLVDVATKNAYLDASGNAPMIAETAVVPLLYFWITKRQFQLPELEGQVVKTAAIAIVAGQLVAPQVERYLNSMNTTPDKK